MSTLLSVENIEKSIGNRKLFEHIGFHLQEKDRLGLIGPNGSGKSTLLKILAGVVEAEDGEITVRNGCHVAYLPQVEDIAPDLTILEAALEVSKSDGLDKHIRESQAVIALSKIDFSDMEEKVGKLSGGWLKRLSIARQIAREPDVLLLDEPTNHLDIEGIEWLEDFLKNAPFAYILVSHDRLFLENTTNKVMELNEIFDDGLLTFDCAYQEFLERRENFITAERSRFESLANKNRREQEWVKFGVKARGTKQKARLQEAENIKSEVSKLRTQTAKPKKVLIDFESTDRKTKRLATLHSVCKSFGDKTIAKGLDLTITPGMRIGLLGNNGVGKTTVMKMIAGELEPDSGSIHVTAGCKILHFNQNRQIMDENQKLAAALSINGSDMVIYRGKEMHITSWARKLKFRGDQLQSPISALSGGERARVIMGRLMLQTADILLLDEPTNDLDIPSIEVLEESLMDFPGALVFVTHDRELLDRVSTVLLALDGEGNITPYASYEQWKKVGKQVEEESVDVAPIKKAVEKPVAKKLTKLSYNEQREWDNMETAIFEAEHVLEELQNNPVDATAEPEAFTTYCEQLADAQEAVENLYNRWTELEAKLAEIKGNKA
jgi:ATP-binding cassette subfamily F protein uup